MGARDIVRGHLRRGTTSILRMLTVGDSINFPWTTSFSNMTARNISNWSAVEFVGQVGYMANHGATGNGTYTSASGGAGFSSVARVRPGEAWPNTLETGLNVRTNYCYYATGDIGAFGDYYQASLYPRGPANQDWCAGSNLYFTLKARTSLNSVTSWLLTAFDGLGVAVGGNINLTGLNAAPSYKKYNIGPWATSSSATSNTKFTSIRAGVETENGTTSRDLGFLDWGIENTSKTKGIFWGYSGHGSWKPANHRDSTGVSITADPPTYTGAYTDAALAYDYTCYSWNHVLIWIGANPNTGITATDIATYKSDILAIIARHRAAAATAGLPAPTFTLVSQYQAGSNDTYFEAMAQALYEIATTDKNVEFIDLYGYIKSTYGSYSAFQATLLSDGTHPSTTGSLIFSNRMAQVAFGGNRPSPSAPAGTGGCRAVSKLAQIGKSRIYRSAA